MNLRFLTLLFCLCTFVPAAYAQEEDPPIEAPPMLPYDGDDLFGSDTSYSQHYMFDAGLTNMRPWALNQALFGGDGFFQLTTLGLTESYSEESNGDDEDSYLGNDLTLSMHWFLANKKTVTRTDGDQVDYKLKGWELMTSFIAVNFIRNEHVDLIIGYGTYWGNLKMYSENRTDNTGRNLYKNPFVAPAVRTELRFNFWILSMGGRFSYRHDITRDNWKRKDDGLDPLPGYKFREMQFMFYVGFRMKDSY